MACTFHSTSFHGTGRPSAGGPHRPRPPHQLHTGEPLPCPHVLCSLDGKKKREPSCRFFSLEERKMRHLDAKWTSMRNGLPGCLFALLETKGEIRNGSGHQPALAFGSTPTLSVCRLRLYSQDLSLTVGLLHARTIFLLTNLEVLDICVIIPSLFRALFSLYFLAVIAFWLLISFCSYDGYKYI